MRRLGLGLALVLAWAPLVAAQSAPTLTSITPSSWSEFQQAYGPVTFVFLGSGFTREQYVEADERLTGAVYTFVPTYVNPWELSTTLTVPAGLYAVVVKDPTTMQQSDPPIVVGVSRP